MITLLNGDCVQGLNKLENNSVDLMLVDPPYFDYTTNYRKKGHKFTNSMELQSRQEIIDTVGLCVDKLKDQSALYLFTSYRNVYWMYEPFEGCIKNMIVWDKGNWSMGDLTGSFGNQYELILLLTKGRWKYRGKRLPDLWSVPRVGTSRIHATEKPVELYEKIIVNSCDTGNLVVDPYAGSGSSAEACRNTHRQYLGWELDPHYFDAAKERLAL